MIGGCARDSTRVDHSAGGQVRFAKGSAIYHEGDRAGHWYEVANGIVRTCRFHADGHRQLTGFYYSGDVFGIDSARYEESAEAVTDVMLRRYPAGSREGEEAASVPALEKALDSARRSIFLFGHRTAANRVAAFLIAMTQRSGAAEDVELPMTRGDIADHLNLTLHTVSRTIGELARKGLIALHGPQAVRILDIDGLRAIAGEVAEEGLTGTWA